jgi:hypothetical protein
MFVTRLMILFAMMRCGNTVSVSRKIVELSGSLVRILWHKIPRFIWCDPARCKDVSVRTTNG